MQNIRYEITGGLTGAQLEMLHDRAMQVLVEMGMELGRSGTLELLEMMPGFHVCGTRVRFSRQMLEECVAASRKHIPEVIAGRDRKRSGKSDWKLEILNGYAIEYVDYSTGSLRPITEADTIESTKLIDVLHSRGVVGSAPGAPQDVPPQIRALRSWHIGAQYCRSGGEAPAVSLGEMKWMMRLNEVLGKPAGVGIFVINPLRAEGDTFDQLLQLRASGRDFSVGVGCMPIMGVSAPMDPLGAFVIAVASIWGAWAIVRALTGKDYMATECRVWPTSMRNLDLVYGSPEMIWSELINEQLKLFYGWEYGDSNAFHSSAVLPDAQAAFTRGAYGMAAALTGKRSYRFGGLLGVDLAFSPEQLVLDCENLGYLRHTIEGFNFNEEAIHMESIFRVGPSGTFLMEDSSLFGYRDVLWEPHLFNHDSIGVWHAKGDIGVLQRAREEVRELIAKHDFRLPEDQLREIDSICQAAEVELLG